VFEGGRLLQQMGFLLNHHGIASSRAIGGTALSDR
jgi:hypothetical protein